MQGIYKMNNEKSQIKIIQLDSIIAFRDSILKSERQEKIEDSIRMFDEIAILKKNIARLEKEKNKIFYKYVTRRNDIDSALVNANKGLNAKYRQLKSD